VTEVKGIETVEIVGKHSAFK